MKSHLNDFCLGVHHRESLRKKCYNMIGEKFSIFNYFNLI